MTVWCNGNIPDFDSGDREGCDGSSPSTVAKETLDLLFSKHSTKVRKIAFKTFVREQGADAVQGKGCGEPSLRKPLLTQ